MAGSDAMIQNIYNKDYNNNIVLYVLFIIVFLLIFILIFISEKSNKIENEYGNWICSGTYNVKLNLTFNKNGQFVFDSSNESDSILVKGSFSFEEYNRDSNDKYKYYRYTLYPYKIIRNELEETEYSIVQYEIAVTKDGKNSIISSTKNNERYSCRKNS